MQTIDPDYFFITPEVIPENYLELLESIEIKKELLLLRCLDNSELNKNCSVSNWHDDNRRYFLWKKWKSYV